LTFSEDKYEAMTSLAKELCGRTDGCGKGMTGSASLHIPNVMFGHDGLLGSNAPIACGFAQATKRPTICILGDAACEEDYVLASFGYAVTHKLPIVFIVEDNGLSILTKTEVRRSWKIKNVADSFGMITQNYYDTDNLSLEFVPFMHACIQWAFECNAPTLLNIKVSRHRWHSGSGTDEEPVFNTMQLMLDRLKDQNSQFAIENVKTHIDFIWKELYNDIKRHDS
jgi:pyruvate dehydrogenase E1 component alpha subunit